jgi:hypothetical protein
MVVDDRCRRAGIFRVAETVVTGLKNHNKKIVENLGSARGMSDVRRLFIFKQFKISKPVH